ncbi:hypothetical protein BH11GEM1_BH11GEM1_14240 [soil metagenome]
MSPALLALAHSTASETNVSSVRFGSSGSTSMTPTLPTASRVLILRGIEEYKRGEATPVSYEDLETDEN